MKVNHNMTAVRTNLNLNRTNTKLDDSTYRLSSGYKINYAKDDPAGYAILHRLNKQIKGLDQAKSNSGDTIATINTAEGALNEIHSMLQRMSELAVQAANDTNTPEDRDTIQDEIDQLLSEVDRVSESTDYNGRTLLNGDSDRTSYVAKKDGAMASKISILSQSTTVLPGSYELKVTKDPTQAQITFALTEGKLSLNGEEITITKESLQNMTAQGDLRTMAERCSLDVSVNGNNVTITSRAYGADAKIEANMNGTKHEAAGTDVEATITTSDDGFTKTAVKSINGNEIVVTDADGFELRITTLPGAAAEGSVTAEVKDASTVQVQVGSEADNMLEVVFERMNTKTLHIDDVNVRTHGGASKAIEAVHNAINKVSMVRSKLGAYTNRLEYAKESADVQSYNVEDASSRMGDTNMAEEMTNYSQLNVLEQATSSILSKANQRAETILQLLQS